MFDFSFGELLLLAVVALLVLGPERLPKVARLAGLWIRKARAQWNSVKAELENELADEELRRNLREASDAMRDSVQKVSALPEVVRNDPAIIDAAAVMKSVDRPRRSARHSAPIEHPPAPAAMSPGAITPPAAALHGTGADPAGNPTSEPSRYDPTQLSLLDPDLMMQMTLLPPANQPRPDDQA
jgi:sec-independent protein translocase protein TatB